MNGKSFTKPLIKKITKLSKTHLILICLFSLCDYVTQKKSLFDFFFYFSCVLHSYTPLYESVSLLVHQSAGLCVCQSVGPSVCQSVGLLVNQSIFKNADKDANASERILEWMRLVRRFSKGASNPAPYLDAGSGDRYLEWKRLART